MRTSGLWLAILSHGLGPASAQTTTSSPTSTTLTSTMLDPADLTYPTTLTTIYTTTHTTASVVTVDTVTIIDPWPTSPDPESVPYTQTELQITQRTVLPTNPSAAAPSPSTIVRNTTWTVWTTSEFDMNPARAPDCPGPDGCSYPTVKPHSSCIERHLETRCYRQCLLKNWMWWCRQNGPGDEADPGLGPIGRVCAGTNSTIATWEPLLEPCDHTDMAPGCSICPGYEDEVPVYFPGR